MEAVIETSADLLQQVPTLKDLQSAIRTSFPGCEQDSKNLFVSDILETEKGFKFRVLDLDTPRPDGSLPAGIFLQTLVEYLPDTSIDKALIKDLSKKTAEILSKTRIIESDLKLSFFTYSKIHHYIIFSLSITSQEQSGP